MGVLEWLGRCTGASGGLLVCALLSGLAAAAAATAPAATTAAKPDTALLVLPALRSVPSHLSPRLPLPPWHLPPPVLGLYHWSCVSHEGGMVCITAEGLAANSGIWW